MLPKRGYNARSGAKTVKFVWPWCQHGRISEPFKAHDKHVPPRRAGGCGHFDGKHSTTGDNAKPTWHFCLNIHFIFRQNDSSLATSKGFFAYIPRPYLTLQ